MRDLTTDMMQHMRLRNPVRSSRSDPPSNFTQPSKQLSIHRRERTTGERECTLTVVREEGVCVLEEGDEDEPVVDPEVGDEVDAEHLGE